MYERVHVQRNLSYKFAANCFLLLKTPNDVIDHPQVLRTAQGWLNISVKKHS